MDGLIAMGGKSLRKGMTLQGARIIDLAPSVLYLLGLPVPISMDGEVLREAFSEAVIKERPVQEIDEKPSPEVLPEEIYSGEEEEELKRRLKTLGYFT